MHKADEPNTPVDVLDAEALASRPGLRLDVNVIGQNARADARSGHAGRIARTDDKLNALLLTAGTLDAIAHHATCFVFGETASPRNTNTA